MVIPPDVYGLNEQSGPIVEGARQIAREVAGPAADDVDRSSRFPDEALRALAAEGYFGLLLPREAGGLAAGPRAFCGVMEALAEGCGSTAMVFLMHALAAHTIAASSTAGRKDELLREMAAGKALATLAYSEETSRSNFWIQGSELVPVSGGAAYELDALKTWVTSAGHAALYVGAARRPGATSGTDFTVFVTRASERSPTFEIVGGYDGLGLRGNTSCRIKLTRHRIEAADLLTEHGRGREFSGKVLVPWFDVGSAAMSNGLCRAAVAATSAHLRETGLHQGKLRDLPTLRARLAEMFVRTEQSRALLGHALAHLENPTPAAKLQLLATRHAAINAAVDVTDLAMKACGGAAFRKEGPVERIFRDARAGWVMGPTSDVLGEMIGRELTGLDPL